MLDERRSVVLGALIEEYIGVGVPVSSRAVLDRSGLSVSSATIRNDLAALERDGYAMQPHTSAGRIPTGRAYRYYVDHLSPVALRSATRVRIHKFFDSVHTELSRLLKATTGLLSEVTHYPAIVIGPGLDGESIRGIHCVPVAPNTVMVVLVGGSGQVAQEMVSLQHPLDSAEVGQAEELLLAAVEGKVQDPDVSGTPPQVAELVRRVWGLTKESERGTRDVYVSGAATAGDAWDDVRSVNSVLEVLEREAMLLSILARANAGTLIQIGEDVSVGADLAVVSTRYALGGEDAGAVGVIGPMRMDYGRTISVVEEVSEVLAGLLGTPPTT
jgi:heat-inducible transcriptional repressor